MRITYDLILRTLNRFEEVGGFEMECLDREFDTPEDALLYFVNTLAKGNPSEFNEEFKRFIFMSDERFNRPWNKARAKALIGILDLKYSFKNSVIFKPWEIF